jgi:hypothetical protein
MSSVTQANCKSCGQISVHDELLEFADFEKIPRAWISGALRDKWQATKTRFVLTKEFIVDVRLKGPPTFNERIERYLLQFIKGLENLTDKRDVYSRDFHAATYCGSKEELKVIVNHLQNDGYLKVPQSQNLGSLSPKGHIHCDELRRERTTSSQGFVAMSFDGDLDLAWQDGFFRGIMSAGYAPMRIDKKDHNNDITDEIIAEIRRSNFVVADLTMHRNGVYFEAGFAMGLDKPVFYTCRDSDMKDTHFDVRQYNCLVWKEPVELASRLSLRIQAVLGAGPLIKV